MSSLDRVEIAGLLHHSLTRATHLLGYDTHILGDDKEYQRALMMMMMMIVWMMMTDSLLQAILAG